MFRLNSACDRFFLLAICMLADGSPVDAANRRWNGTSGSFLDTARWQGGIVPGALDVAQFGVSGAPFQSTYTVSFAANVTNQALHIEDDLVTFDLNARQYTVTTTNGIVIGNQPGGLSGRLTVIDGTVSSSTNIDVGAASNTTGTLIIGAGGLISGSPTLNIGKLGTGTLTVQTDGDISSTGSTTIGVANGITGIATIIGNGTAGSATLLTGALNVGSTGNGTVNVQLAGLLQNSGAASIGSGSLFTGVGTGIVNVMNAGSVWNSVGLLEVGDGGSGKVNVTLGGKVNSIDTVVGSSLSSTGEVNVDGQSSLWDSSGTLTIGALGFGTINVTNKGMVDSENAFVGTSALMVGTGTINVSGAGSQWVNRNQLHVGRSGTGAMNVSSGAKVFSPLSSVGFDSNGAGTVTVNGIGSQWFNSDELVVGEGGNGTLEVTAGGQLLTHVDTIGGASSGNGLVTVDGDGSRWDSANWIFVGVRGHGELEITGGGLVLTNSSNNLSHTIIGDEAGSTGLATVDGVGSHWDINRTFSIGGAGEGTVDIKAGGTVTGDDVLIGLAPGGKGHIDVDGDGSTFNTSQDLTIGRGGTGTLHITNGGVVTSNQSAYIGEADDSTGTVTVSSTVVGVSSTWEISKRLGIGLDPFAGTLQDGGTGTLRAQPGGLVNVAEDTVVWYGSLLNLEGGTLSTTGISFPFGANAGDYFEWTSGTLHVGTFEGDLINQAGVLAPPDTGITSINGNYNQLAAAKLEIEIEGQGAANGYDLVVVDGNAFLGGELELVLKNGFIPSFADQFHILTADFDIFGAFANVANGQRLTTSDGLASFVVNYGAGSEFDPKQVVLSNFLVAGLPGDYNQNGTVDAADYVVWRKNAGTTNALPNDPIGGMVGMAHYNQWRAHFGQPPGSGAVMNSTVPEPATLALLLAGILMMGFRQRLVVS